jgi:hypothetical protein
MSARRVLMPLLALTLCGGCGNDKSASPKVKAPPSAAAQRDSPAQQRLLTFLERLRAAMVVPPGQTADRSALLEKLRGIPATGLPPDLDAAWQEMLTCCQLAAGPEGPADALARRGQTAAARLNEQLRANGCPDLSF